MDNTTKKSLDSSLINPINSDTTNDVIDTAREEQIISVVDRNIIENDNEMIDEQQRISVTGSNIVRNYNATVEDQQKINITDSYITNNDNETIDRNRSLYNIQISEDNYGYIKDENGQDIQVTKYTLSNKQKVFVEIIDYGATVISCWVPNALGELEDVLLGFDSIDDYSLRNKYAVGSTLGRVTDYITSGRIKDDNGNIIELSRNRGDHHFHGGEKSFDKVMWDGYIENDKLVLTYSSKDGEEGYPGTFHIRTTFHLTCKNELIIDYVGMTSKPTPVNISSNMFFNLAGHNTGESEIVNHTIMVNADKYVVVKLPERRPVGWLKNVNQTCLDLRVPRLLKKAFPLVEGFGYNHTFKLFKGSERKAFNLAVSLSHKPSGRILDIYTDMPCVFINTAQEFPNYGSMLHKEEILNVTDILSPSAKFGANGYDQSHSVKDEYASRSDMDLMLQEGEDEEEDKEYVICRPSTHTYHSVHLGAPIVGKSKTVYSKHSGVCIRPQLFPDAITHTNFNCVILKPSNIYSQQTIYKFGVIHSK